MPNKQSQRQHKQGGEDKEHADEDYNEEGDVEPRGLLDQAVDVRVLLRDLLYLRPESRLLATGLRIPGHFQGQL